MGSGKNITERLFALYARANYSYNDKYMVSATIRHEGSSKFAAENRWGNFGRCPEVGVYLPRSS